MLNFNNKSREETMSFYYMIDVPSQYDYKINLYIIMCRINAQTFTCIKILYNIKEKEAYIYICIND